MQRTICEAVVQKCFFFALFYFLLRLVKKNFILSTFPRISRENAPYRGIFLQVVKKESGNDKNSLVKKLFVNKCTTITQFDRNLHRLFVRYYLPIKLMCNNPFLEHFADLKRLNASQFASYERICQSFNDPNFSHYFPLYFV